jgi:predicted flap endonuclease-1-like 5' DNA nuclease
MAWTTQVSGIGAAQERVSRAISFPVGAASPLWFAFGAAASAGVAFWWMTRWMRPANLEAAFTMMRSPALEAVQAVEIIAETLETSLEEALEAIEYEPEPFEEPAVAREPEPQPIIPDDLTRIVGIGPKLADALAARGVATFAQIAAWTADELAELDTALNLKGRAVRDAWVAQAARLAGTTH